MDESRDSNDVPFDIPGTSLANAADHDARPLNDDDLDLRVESSKPFIGQWNQLISQTNWEKGQIISQWREALVAEDAPATSFSDEAWSRMVGGVTSQHVGRLRRVHHRFGATHVEFEGLYWSHFQAALDWDDAEMWLEGAVQNSWSVSQMRKNRWETMGADPRLKPDDSDVITGDIDEDYEPLRSHSEDAQGTRDFNGETGPRMEGPDFGDETERRQSIDGPTDVDFDVPAASAQEQARPFENIKELPEDLAEAFDLFKLSIIRHKAAGWQEIELADVLGCLEALQELARIPLQSDSEA